ncbi:response regulator [Pseudomonadota bacterium AL_CKDN230030165-1A_HGKHYDSX7]
MSNTAAPRIVLVDDNEMAAELLSEFLMLSGLDVRVAYDGAQALAACETFQPHTVVLDILLPDIDGYELANRLRQQQRPAPRLIALSGLARVRGDGRGDVFDDWIEKPADPDALLALLSQP